jgi:hypothetical protein
MVNIIKERGVAVPFIEIVFHIKNKYFTLKETSKYLSLIVLLIICSANTKVSAAPIAIDYFSSFLNSTDIGAISIEDTQIGSGFNEFGAAGFDTIFVNNLNADNLGSVSWTITNKTGGDILGTSFFSFLDAEITEPGNSFFNEYGELVSVTGSGAADTSADSWEIDEPGFSFGNIYDNIVYDGMLDNTNSVPSSSVNDVSLALGFNVGDFLVNQTLVATFTISDQNIGGLSHTDPDSMTKFYFNGTVELLPITVPEPKTLFLLALGLVLLTMRRFVS